MSVRRGCRCGAWKGLLLVALGGCVEPPVVCAQFTESASTVAPGTWFFESDLVNHGSDKSDDGVRYRNLAAGYLQLTRGLSDRLDVQIGMQAYQREDIREHGLHALHLRESRWADVCVRAKRGVFVNEEGWNVSLLPFVTLPLERDDADHRFAQIGLIIPLTRSLAVDWTMDAQVQLDGAKSDGERRDWTWLASANVQRAWSDRWGTYFEVISSFDGDASDAAISGGVGLTRVVGRGGWDVGVYRGVTDEAVDWEVAVRLYWEI